MNELALFAGAGGGILAGQLLGWRTLCAVERNEYARNVLLARQNDRILEPFPVWDDVTTFDGRPWNKIIDVVSGGFPCQDISIARSMWGRDGLQGSRSGLVFEMLRIIQEVQPSYVFGENSPELARNGIDDIINILESIGYTCAWAIIGADDIGLPHQRKRLWFIAHSNRARLERHSGDVYDQERRQNQNRQAAHETVRSFTAQYKQHILQWSKYFDTRLGISPEPVRACDDVAHRVDRVQATGNGQVPIVAAIAFTFLKTYLESSI